MKDKTAIEKLLQCFPEYVDAALITNDANCRYFTGFPCNEAYLLISPQVSVLLVDTCCYEEAKDRIDSCEIILYRDAVSQLEGLFSKYGIKNIALEQSTCTLTMFEMYRRGFPDATLVTDKWLDDTISDLRRYKSEFELQNMRVAQSITDQVFEHLLHYIHPGLTEREIALEMELYGRSLGADALAFAIVASGENSAKPHAIVTDREIAKGDLLLMDFGFWVDGYCSDMTRTIAISQVSSRQREAYEIVYSAQREGVDAIRPGVCCSEADRRARKVIDASDFAGTFCTALGHSLGLDIHELPYLCPESTDILTPGICVTVEPGIYLPGEFGIRIEDAGVCTESGFDNFTESSKELIIV